MAIAFAAAHGVTSDRLTGTTIAHSTSGAVAAGDHIVVQVMWFSAAVTLSSFSGGGLTWQIDVQGEPSTDRHIAIGSAYAPAGLAAGTTITANFSATTTDRSIGIDSFSGMNTSDWVGVANLVNNTSTSTWSTGSIAISAGSMLLAMVHEDASATASAPVAGSTELHDQQVTGTTDMWVSGYRIEASAGSYAVGGTWTGTASQSSVGYVEYLVAGGAGDQTVNPGAIASGSQLHAPTAQPGSVTVSPSAIASGSQLYAPTMTSTVTVSPAAIASGEALYAPTLTPGAVTVSPAHLTSGAIVHQPTTDGDATLSPAAIASTAQVYAPRLDYELVPAAIGSGSQLYAPTVTPGSVTVSPALLASGAQVYTPTLEGGDTPAATRFPWVPSMPQINNDDIGKAVQ